MNIELTPEEIHWIAICLSSRADSLVLEDESDREVIRAIHKKFKELRKLHPSKYDDT